MPKVVKLARRVFRDNGLDRDIFLCSEARVEDFLLMHKVKLASCSSFCRMSGSCQVRISETAVIMGCCSLASAVQVSPSVLSSLCVNTSTQGFWVRASRVKQVQSHLKSNKHMHAP